MLNFPIWERLEFFQFTPSWNSLTILELTIGIRAWSQLFCRFNYLLRDLKAQESIMRRGEEITLTNSSQVTNGYEEMCLMAIENSGNHLVGEGQSIVRPPLFISDNYAY